MDEHAGVTLKSPRRLERGFDCDPTSMNSSVKTSINILRGKVAKEYAIKKENEEWSL
jgi:hypothetical protein